MAETTASVAPYDAVATQTLIQAYAEGPPRLRRVLDGVTEIDLQAHPRPGKWSIQQIVLHLADAEVVGATRIRQAYAEPGCTFPVYDQDGWAEQFRYGAATPGRLEVSLRLFEALRKTTLPLFENATEADWQKTGFHPERGALTLRNLLETYADHSERHIEQILDRRALLGHPLDFPLLLETRLY